MAYATRMDWADGHNWVILSRDDVEVARMTLDELSKLKEVAYLIEDAVAQALHEAEEVRLVGHYSPADTAEGGAA
jgi:hypothetical protein